MDLSRINSIAAARCEFRPDEELRMMSETKASSTNGFSSDWKNSCSISLIRLWLCELRRYNWLSRVVERLTLQRRERIVLARYWFCLAWTGYPRRQYHKVRTNRPKGKNCWRPHHLEGGRDKPYLLGNRRTWESMAQPQHQKVRY